MKKVYSLLATTLLFVTAGFAQVTVTVDVPTNTTPNLAPSYTSLASALTALNAVTAMSGPVTLTSAAGSETAPTAAGFMLGSATLNPVLSATNTITLNTSGGAVTLNAAAGGTGTPGTAVQDGIFALLGADYITIDGFTLTDGNAANPATMEFGIGLFKLSATDGANNNTIRNCIITLNRINNASGGTLAVDGSRGINVVNALVTTQTTVVTVTAASGSNSNNKFYSNTIQNCNIGMAVIGFAAASPFTLADQNNDIGGAALATGNTIKNFGGAPAATNPAAGIRTLAQYSLNISYNTVNSNDGGGVIHPSTLRGIYTNTALSASETISNNTVTIQGGGLTSSILAFENQAGGTAAGNTVSITNNTITGCTYTTATSGTFTGILSNATAANVNINNNSFTNNSTNATSGTTTMISSTGLPTVSYNINGNNINGWTFNAVSSGTFNGINSTIAPSTAAQSISTNNFQAITYATTGTGAHNYILYNSAASSTCNVNGNTFTNLNVNTTGSVTFVTRGTSSMTATGSESFSNNSIVTAFNKGGAGGTVTCWTVGGGGSSVNGSTMLQNLNNFSNITLTGATAFVGISNSEGASSSNGPTKTITNNTFNNITTGAAQFTGISPNFSGPNSTYSNNTITNITNAGVILGMNIGTSNGQGTHTCAFNTITNLTSNSPGGGVNGIQGGSSAIVTLNVNNNTIRAISVTGGANQINGIITTAGTTVNIFKNNLSDFQSDNVGGTVDGLAVIGSTTTNVYNNFVSNLRAPSSGGATGVTAIYGMISTTACNYYYNTIAIGKSAPVTSTGTDFGVTGIGYGTAATKLNNNIIWIDATPVGTGAVVVVRRGAAGTANTPPTVTNFSSNNNIYNVQSPGANKYLYGEGATVAALRNAYGINIGIADDAVNNLKNDPSFNSGCLSLYKIFMGGRESATFNEDNLVALGGATFAPSGSSLAESNAVPITTPLITDDYAGTARSATPDIGALEFAGIATDAAGPSISYTPLITTVCLTAPVLNVVINDASGVNTTPGTEPRLYYRKGGATPENDVFGNYPADNTSAFNGWKYVVATGTAPNFSFAIDYSKLTSPVAFGDSITYFVIAQDNVGTPNVGRNTINFNAGFCPSSVNIPVTGAAPTSGSGGYKISAVGDADFIMTAPLVVLGPSGTNAYTVAGRTLEAGEPSPIQNTTASGSGQSNYSWGSVASSTAWLKLVVPTTGYGSSGNLAILADTSTGSASSDNQLAVWEFPNMPSTCGAAANFTGAKLLQANDDRIENGQVLPPGEVTISSLNALVRVRLVPGNTYYLQVDGFGSATPFGNVYVYDLAQAPYSIANNGLGNYFNPATTNTMRFASYEVDGADGWTYYYDNNNTGTTFTDDSVLLAINWSSNPNYYYNGTFASGTSMVDHIRGNSARTQTAPSTLGTFTTTDSLVVWVGRNSAPLASNDLKATAPYVQPSAAHWWMMNKYWSVLPRVQPSSAVGVRFFYSDADFNALQSTVISGGGVLAAHADMRFIKATKSPTTHYTNAELDPGQGHANLLLGTVVDIPWTNTDGVATGINQSQFNVTVFSGGGAGSTGDVVISPIPVQLLSFTAQRTGKINVLNWSTAQEFNSKHFVIEHSTNGSSFNAIGQVTAAGNSSTVRNYTFTHSNPVVGINYYRLRIVDKDNNYKNSLVRSVRNEGIADVAVYPNPVKDMMTVSISADKASAGQMTINDVSGKIIYSSKINVSQGANNLPVNLANLASGTYMIKVQLGDDFVVKKFTKL